MKIRELAADKDQFLKQQVIKDKDIKLQAIKDKDIKLQIIKVNNNIRDCNPLKEVRTTAMVVTTLKPNQPRLLKNLHRIKEVKWDKDLCGHKIPIQ